MYYSPSSIFRFFHSNFETIIISKDKNSLPPPTPLLLVCLSLCLCLSLSRKTNQQANKKPVALYNIMYIYVFTNIIMKKERKQFGMTHHTVTDKEEYAKRELWAQLGYNIIVVTSCLLCLITLTERSGVNLHIP